MNRLREEERRRKTLLSCRIIETVAGVVVLGVICIAAYFLLYAVHYLSGGK